MKTMAKQQAIDERLSCEANEAGATTDGLGRHIGIPPEIMKCIMQEI
jgi:hypothetical protein